jgi:pyruvate/2-oxoglutarate dehydrogenase complex dihydrolipoamide acyltransferase (E2) component
VARVTLLALLVVAHPAHAQDCNPHEVWTLRAHLEEEAHRAAVWNWGWRITFTTAAVGSLAVAVANPYPDYQDGL